MKKKSTTKSQKQDKKWFITTIILVIIVVISCLSLMFINMSRPMTDQNNSGVSTGQYETYQAINSDELFALLDETGTVNTVYVGRDTCPHCSAFGPKLIEVIQEEGILVYYYDTAAARADDVEKLNELMNELDVSSVPALLKIENGEVVMRLDDYDSKETISNFLNNI